MVTPNMVVTRLQAPNSICRGSKKEKKRGGGGEGQVRGLRVVNLTATNSWSSTLLGLFGFSCFYLRAVKAAAPVRCTLLQNQPDKC